MRSGITRRWLRGNLLITVLLVLLAEAMFLYSYTRSYYNSVQQTMYRRFLLGDRPAEGLHATPPQCGRQPQSWRCGAWWSSMPIRTSTSSCCWTATAASSPPPAARDADGIVSSNLDFVQALRTPPTGWAWRCTAPVRRGGHGGLLAGALRRRGRGRLRLVTSLAWSNGRSRTPSRQSRECGGGHPDLSVMSGCTSCAASWCRWGRWSALPPTSPAASSTCACR